MTSRLSDVRLREIRERRQAISGAPWSLAGDESTAEWWWSRPAIPPDAVIVSRSDECPVAATNDDGITTVGDIAHAAFIANAPSDIDALLAEVERLRSPEVRELAAKLRGWAIVVGQAAVDDGTSTALADDLSEAARRLDAGEA